MTKNDLGKDLFYLTCYTLSSREGKAGTRSRGHGGMPLPGLRLWLSQMFCTTPCNSSSRGFSTSAFFVCLYSCAHIHTRHSHITEKEKSIFKTEDQHSVPSIYIRKLRVIHNYSSRGFQALFLTSLGTYKHVMYTYIYTKINH